ncbi:YugN family protein [Viridibacillus arvi]|uniref:YugN family protein n=1 Tax=Viridibacillus arvi TaxID=263475 RepID=UPI003D063DF4
MIRLQSPIEGRKTHFGYIRDIFEEYGCDFSSNFEYDQGQFDSILWREAGETIYLRLPFIVLEGELDHYEALIAFGSPYVIKHVVNIGLDRDENALATVAGISQFQKPLDKDGHIEDKSRWVQASENKIEKLLYSLEEPLSS